MPRLLFKQQADGRIDIVKNIDSLLAAEPLHPGLHETGFVAMSDRNAHGGRVDRVERFVMWGSGVVLAAVSVFFAYRCVMFIEG